MFHVGKIKLAMVSWVCCYKYWCEYWELSLMLFVK